MKKGITYGEYLFGKKEHKKQMKRVKQSEKKVYCKNCKYKVKYGLGCWHPSMDTGDDWNPEIDRTSCPHYKRKHWWKMWVK